MSNTLMYTSIFVGAIYIVVSLVDKEMPKNEKKFQAVMGVVLIVLPLLIKSLFE